MNRTLFLDESCPETLEDWSDRAAVKCTKYSQYHCLEDEFSRTVEVCVEPVWIDTGYCTIYKTESQRIGFKFCKGRDCPLTPYESNEVYKYKSCRPYSRSVISNRLTSTARSTSQIFWDTTSPTTSSNIAAIVGPVIGILVVVTLAIIGVIVCRKKGRKGFLQGRGNCSNGSEQGNNTENEPFYPRHEDPPQITCSNEDTIALDYCKILPREMSCFLLILRDHQTLVLFGKWGSGKRTLAKQISSKLAQNEGLKITLVRHFISIPDDLESKCSTVLILEDPFRPQYTDKHNAEIFDCLLNLRANAKQNQNFLLVLFHCDDMKVTEQLCLDAEGRKFNRLFPENMVVRINIPIGTLTKIAQSKDVKISSKDVKQIVENNTNSGMGHTLTLTLFLKNPFYRHTDFLKDPITFVLEKLKEMAMNEHVQFTTLVHMILDDKEITKSEVEEIVNQGVSDNSDKVNLTTECILQRYVEETIDGKSYRLVHDVITRCILYTALKHDIQRNLVYKECDSLLLLSCFRHKTFRERFISPGEFFFDEQTLDIGIPTESIPYLAETFGQRNDMMTMLRNARLCEDREFQNKWLEV